MRPSRRSSAPGSVVGSLAIVAASALLGCAGATDAESTRGRLAGYFDAVQSGDASRIAPFLADCADADCAQPIADLTGRIAEQRDAGRYSFDDAWGFGLVTALVLGRGGFWTVERVERRGDALVGTVLVRTQYRRDETRDLPPGTAIDYLGRPLGHVDRLVKGERRAGGLRWQLAEVELEVHLEAAGDPETWRLRSLRARPETAIHEQVTWRPQ